MSTMAETDMVTNCAGQWMQSAYRLSSQPHMPSNCSNLKCKGHVSTEKMNNAYECVAWLPTRPTVSWSICQAGTQVIKSCMRKFNKFVVHCVKRSGISQQLSGTDSTLHLGSDCHSGCQGAGHTLPYCRSACSGQSIHYAAHLEHAAFSSAGTCLFANSTGSHPTDTSRADAWFCSVLI